MDKTQTSLPLGLKPDWLPLWPVLLYSAVPLLLLALPLALFRVTVGPDVSLVLSLFFWSATVMVGWLAGALGSQIVFRAFASFRPPLWIITLAGPVLAGLVLHQPILEILSLTKAIQTGNTLVQTPAPMSLSWAFFWSFFVNLAPGTVCWMVTNYVFDRMLGISRFRYPALEAQEANIHPATPVPATKSADAELPSLVARLPRSERAPILAIISEDHYVRVYTEAGDGLILLRLCDAIAMARPTSGIQVHRSSWVAHTAIKQFRRTGHSGILSLTNSQEVRVSRSYCGQVEKWVNSLTGTVKANTPN